jgi:hypothetical protein
LSANAVVGSPDFEHRQRGIGLEDAGAKTHAGDDVFGFEQPLERGTSIGALTVDHDPELLFEDGAVGVIDGELPHELAGLEADLQIPESTQGGYDVH